MRVTRLVLLVTLAVAAAACENGCTRNSNPDAAPEAGAIPAPPDVAAPPADASRTASGLASKVLKPGTGTQHPGPTSRVRVHYTGWTTNGEMFDSTYARGEPATIPIADAVSGFRQGLQLMVEGEKRRLWIPESLAFRGAPGAPRGMLVFDVELLKIEK